MSVAKIQNAWIKKSAAEQRKHFSEAKLERIALIILFSPDLILKSQIIIS